MEALTQLLATLGTPMLLKRIEAGDRLHAAVARWQFHGAIVNVDASDAARVVMCLFGAQTVRWDLEGAYAKRRIDAGSISVMSPSEPPGVMIQGYVDVVQVLLTPAFIMDAAGHAGTRMRSSFDTPRHEFRRPMLQALVAASRHEPDDRLYLDSVVHGLARQLATAQPEPPRSPPGGLSPSVRRRVTNLIQDRLDHVPDEPPGLCDLADAAGLSVHHFIKAFRQSMGSPPTPMRCNAGCKGRCACSRSRR